MHWTYRCATCGTTPTGLPLVACINADHEVLASHPLVPEEG